MATFQQLKQNLGNAWEQLAEGWDQLTRKAASAITRFTTGSKNDRNDEEHKELISRNSGWGVLAAEVFDDGNRIVVRLEAPGLETNEFDVQAVDNVLIISGEKRVHKEHTEGHYHVTECAYGRFERAINLPDEVDPEQAQASYKKGILRIELPKAAHKKRRTINIQAS